MSTDDPIIEWLKLVQEAKTLYADDAFEPIPASNEVKSYAEHGDVDDNNAQDAEYAYGQHSGLLLNTRERARALIVRGRYAA
jgi:hypothetical protein